jgi:hypothetical protein
MAQGANLDALLERLRGRIGITSAQVVRKIEAGALIKFARATGQTDPLYIDEEAARATDLFVDLRQRYARPRSDGEGPALRHVPAH